MPSFQTIRSSVASLTDGPPLVVALVGGTTGIGSYVAKAFAQTFAAHGSKLRVYIVGRNAERADTVLRFGRKTSPGSDWRFIQATNLALISQVDAACKDLMRQEEEDPFHGGPARLDALYMTAGLSPLAPSPTTEEGIDSQISLLYYARIRFAQNLVPLLTASPRTAHVISVFAGSIEDKVKPDQLPIGIPDPASYGVTAVRTHTCFMKTFLFESLAEQYAGKISFIHIHPGLVDGPAFYLKENPLWFRILWTLMKPLASLIMTSPEDCGRLMLFLSTPRYPAKGTLKAGDGHDSNVALSSQKEIGGGAYALDRKGDTRNEVSWARVRREDTATKVWEHTMGVLQAAEQKKAAGC